MKYSILLLLPLIAFANEDTLTPSEHNSIHGYNNRPIVKMGKTQKMHRLHKVDETEAAEIVKKETGEEVQKMKLSHKGNILQYSVVTKNYTLIVNAMDGTIIQKEKR